MGARSARQVFSTEPREALSAALRFLAVEPEHVEENLDKEVYRKTTPKSLCNALANFNEARGFVRMGLRPRLACFFCSSSAPGSACVPLRLGPDAAAAAGSAQVCAAARVTTCGRFFPKDCSCAGESPLPEECRAQRVNYTLLGSKCVLQGDGASDGEHKPRHRVHYARHAAGEGRRAAAAGGGAAPGKKGGRR